MTHFKKLRALLDDRMAKSLTAAEAAYYGPDDEEEGTPGLTDLVKSLGARFGVWSVWDLLKALAHVKAHTRRTKSGKVVTVKDHTMTVDTKKLESALVAKLRAKKDKPEVYKHGTGLVNPEGRTTAEKYGHDTGHENADTGHSHRYSKERHQLHKMLVGQTVDHVAPSRKPIAILTAGGTASGKSSIMPHLRAVHAGSHEFAHIDADGFKQHLPEYKGMVDSGDPRQMNDAAWHAHAESAHLVGASIAHCMKHGKSFVYDSTSSHPGQTADMITKLKALGYEVHMHYADLPVERALEREEQRFQEEGRKVPEDVVRRTHAGATATLAHVHHMVDSLHVYDTDVPHRTPAKLAYARKGDEVHHHDEAHTAKMEARGHTFLKPKAEATPEPEPTPEEKAHYGPDDDDDPHGV